MNRSRLGPPRAASTILRARGPPIQGAPGVFSNPEMSMNGPAGGAEGSSKVRCDGGVTAGQGGMDRPRLEAARRGWDGGLPTHRARVLGVPHATVELAEFREEHQNRRGSASESFVSHDEELVHGNQVLEWTVGDYDPSIRFGQSWAGRLAPSFDHASSLGRELLDRKRLQLLKERRVRQYSKKGRGGIYWSRDARYGPSPLELVRKAVAAHPVSFEASLERLPDLRDALVSEIVNWVPSDWMSRSAREFAISLITCNRNQLMELSR